MPLKTGRLELDEILYIILLQNDEILSRLQSRESRLTPEDRAILDEVIKIEKRDIRNITEAMKK